MIFPPCVLACRSTRTLLHRAKIVREISNISYDDARDTLEKERPGSYAPCMEVETWTRAHWHNMDTDGLTLPWLPRRRVGRPTRWTAETAGLLMELFGRRLMTKRAAAKKVGIGYQTFMDWQRQRPAWGKALNALHWQSRFQWAAEAVRQWNEQREAKRLQRRGARPVPRPRPTKQMRMVCWYLVHRVHPQNELAEMHESIAAIRFGMTWSRWVAARTIFPGLMVSVQKKRARRLAYGLEHGRIANGWTPPDPYDGRTGNYPWGNLYWERGKYGREFDD